MEELRSAFRFLRDCIDFEPRRVPEKLGRYEVKYSVIDPQSDLPVYTLLFSSHPLVKSLHVCESGGKILYTATLKTLSIKPRDLRRMHVELKLLNLRKRTRVKKLRGLPVQGGSEAGGKSLIGVEMARGAITLRPRSGQYFALAHSDSEEVIRALQRHSAVIRSLSRPPPR